MDLLNNLLLAISQQIFLRVGFKKTSSKELSSCNDFFLNQQSTHFLYNFKLKIRDRRKKYDNIQITNTTEYFT